MGLCRSLSFGSVAPSIWAGLELLHRSHFIEFREPILLPRGCLSFRCADTAASGVLLHLPADPPVPVGLGDKAELFWTMAGPVLREKNGFRMCSVCFFCLLPPASLEKSTWCTQRTMCRIPSLQSVHAICFPYALLKPPTAVKDSGRVSEARDVLPRFCSAP